MSILFADIESTGLDKEKHALVEIAAIPYDTEKGEPIVLRMRPFDGALIDPDTLRITGMNRDEIMSWADPRDQLYKFIEWIDTHEKKFRIGGHNIRFDIGFIHRWFMRYGCYTEYHTRFRSDTICTFEMAKKLDLKKKGKSESNKLGDLCKAFNIKLDNAHSALPDIEATVELYEILKSMMPKIVNHKFNGNHQEARRKFLDLSYVIFNPEGDIFINEKATKDPEALRFILSEIWDLYCSD